MEVCQLLLQSNLLLQLLSGCGDHNHQCTMSLVEGNGFGAYNLPPGKAEKQVVLCYFGKSSRITHWTCLVFAVTRHYSEILASFIRSVPLHSC